MINNLYRFVENLIKFNLYNFLVFFISIFLIFIFYNLFKFKFNFIDYKIKNFKLNSLFIFIYFFLFIFGILFLRYLRLENEVDLIKIFFIVKKNLNDFSFLGIFNVILVILIFFSLINKIKIFLYYQIKKKHFHYYFYSFCNTIKYFIEKQRREPLDCEHNFYV